MEYRQAGRIPQAKPDPYQPARGPMNHTIPLAGTLSNVAPSRIRELADYVFGMDGVYRLHFGESDLPTPRYIKDAAVQALDEGYTFYTENAGLPGLREALASKYADIHGVNIAPGEVLITASGVPGPQRLNPLRDRSRRRSHRPYAELAQCVGHCQPLRRQRD